MVGDIADDLGREHRKQVPFGQMVGFSAAGIPPLPRLNVVEQVVVPQGRPPRIPGRAFLIARVVYCESQVLFERVFKGVLDILHGASLRFPVQYTPLCNKCP